MKVHDALVEPIRISAQHRCGIVGPGIEFSTHQGGVNPPRIIIHGNALDRVPESYKRYLEGFFRKKFALTGTPMRIEFRTGRNPYAGRR